MKCEIKAAGSKNARPQKAGRSRLLRDKRGEGGRKEEKLGERGLDRGKRKDLRIGLFCIRRCLLSDGGISRQVRKKTEKRGEVEEQLSHEHCKRRRNG